MRKSKLREICGLVKVILLVKAECSSNSGLLAPHPRSFPSAPRFQIRPGVYRATLSAAEAYLKMVSVATSGSLAFYPKNTETCIQCWGMGGPG